MAHNTYVRNGSVQRFEDGAYRGAILYGERKFDPHALFGIHRIPHTHIGQPHEMVLHVAGVTYYPTPDGYERIEQK